MLHQNDGFSAESTASLGADSLGKPASGTELQGGERHMKLVFGSSVTFPHLDL